MTNIQCFLVEPTGRNQRYLRRYSSSSQPHSACPGPFSYHNAKSPIDVVPDGEEAFSRDANRPGWPHDDPRWPTRCSCGYTFQDSDQWQVFVEPIYRRTDTGEGGALRDFPAGAMYFAPWLEGVEPYKSRSPDGRVIFVRTPGGDWCLDDEASGGGGWTRSGQAPRITASPSILFPNKDGTERYHGWLRDGVLVRC